MLGCGFGNFISVIGKPIPHIHIPMLSNFPAWLVMAKTFGQIIAIHTNTAVAQHETPRKNRL
ncbi:Uncharacterised protein [Vibrio cholerae]|nr:Uncharacterised protein [Vibrio cholerae]